MSKILLAGALALAMTTGIAVAQTTTSSSSQTTTTAAPAPDMPVIVAPPAGTLSTSTTSRSTAPDGTQTDRSATTYRNTDGVAEDSTSKTTTIAPATPAISSTWSKSTTTTTD